MEKDLPLFANRDMSDASDADSAYFSLDSRLLAGLGYSEQPTIPNPCPKARYLSEVRSLSRAKKHAEALRLLDEAAASELGKSPSFLQHLAIERSLVQLSAGHAKEALELAENLVDELRNGPSIQELGLALLAQAGALRSLARLDEAIRSLIAAQHIFEWQLKNREQTIRILGLVAIIQKRRGKYALAEEALEQALNLCREIGDDGRETQNKTNLAVLQIRMGAISRAEALLIEAIGSRAAAENHLTRVWASLGLSIIKLIRNDERFSRTLLLRVLRGDGRCAAGRDMILCFEYLADAALQDGRPTRALDHLDRALSRARENFSGSDLICEIQRRRSEVLTVMGAKSDAMEAAREAMGVGQNIGEPFELALASRSMGGALEAHDDLPAAMLHYQRCEEILRGIGEKFDLARTLLRVASLHKKLGTPEKARGAIREAELLFERMGLENWQTTCRSALGRLDEPPTLPRLAIPLGPSPESFGILSHDDRIQRAFASLARVAQSKLPVLIEGESGTGKELFARALHGLSARAKGPFLPLNCGAIPPDMQEAELFGHSRGAFTGAVTERIGYFESAHLGTLFLDEIGEMSLAAQTRLLRVLETDEFCRVGESRVRRLDVRYVAATNQVLDDAVSQREFRLDLFQRLNGLRIQIPALRNRPQDVPLLFHHFLDQFRHEGRPAPLLSRALMARLSDYPWPGNVRELRRAVERAVILASDSSAFDEEHFPFLSMSPMDGVGSLPDEIADMERGRLLEALEKTRWSKSGAARLLGMSRTTLNSKMQRHGIPLDVPERYRPPRG